MSDYLVNLARRSAGLAPMVRARVAPPAASLDSAVDVAVESEGSRALNSAPRVDVAPAVSTGAIEQPVPGPGAPIVAATPAIAIASIAPPAIQRAPMAAIALPPIAAPLALPVVTPPSDVRSSPVVGVQAETPAPDATSDTRSVPSNESTVVTRIFERVIEAVPPASPTERPAFVDAEPSESPRVQPRERADEGARVAKEQESATERLEAVAVMIEPAPRPEAVVPAAASRTDVSHTAERTVHVRIGAIEIHSEDSTHAPKPAPPAAPLAVAATSSPTSSGGFDEFMALRSYAPWTW